MYYRVNTNEDETNNMDKNMGYPSYWKPGMPQPIQDYQMMPFQYQNLYLYGTPEHNGNVHVYVSPFHYQNPYSNNNSNINGNGNGNSNQRVGMLNYNCMGVCPFIYWKRVLNEYWWNYKY